MMNMCYLSSDWHDTEDSNEQRHLWQTETNNLRKEKEEEEEKEKEEKEEKEEEEKEAKEEEKEEEEELR